MCANGRIAGVGKRARLSIAETCDIVFIAAEVFLLCGPINCQLEQRKYVRGTNFNLNEQNCWFITCQTISSEDMVRMPVKL